MTTLPTAQGVYLGDRGIGFKTLITGLLKKGKLRDKYINVLISPKNLALYASAFTSDQIDKENNYQVFEQLGDLSGNKFIVWYIYRRFPQLRRVEGVKVAARLRINYEAKNSFCQIAEQQGFWEFISAPNDLRQRKKKSLLEDVFEAFLGVTESILDDSFCCGVGYACVYKILASIFDEMKISLRYEDLYDAKTRLKELFDLHHEKLGPLLYEEQRDGLVTHSFVYRLQDGKYETTADGFVNTKKIVGRYKKIKIGHGSAALKADAQQIASEDALRNLEKEGYVKYAPSIYRKFSQGEIEDQKTTVVNVLRIIGEEKNIDEQFPTRGKTKYKTKYTSTVLAKYCREKNWSGIKICLNMGANPNTADSDGLSALDILLVNRVKKKLLERIMKKFLLVVDCLNIRENIKQFYYLNYKEEFFSLVRLNILSDEEVILI